MANTVEDLYWAQIIFCIVWICTGALLLFTGAASYTWFSRVGSRERSAVLPNGKRVKSRRPWLAGGVGGAVVGFLFISWLVLLIVGAICSRGRSAPGTRVLFAIWLVPAATLGLALGGHFRFVGRTFAGLLAGPSMTLILTAVFGIHTLTARVVLLSIFTSLFTAPLLTSPRSTGIVWQRHILSASTSTIGIVTFLTGVALFAPPEDSSGAWIDLWALLFAPDGSSTQAAAISPWGTPAFKGYIAGATLGVVVGGAVQYFLHAHAGVDAQEEWNDYLAGYTERFVGKSNSTPFDSSRAGLFEEPPTAWERISGLFKDSARRPAAYSHGGAFGSSGGHFTELNSARYARSVRSGRSRKASSGPARFSALAKGEKDAAFADEFELPDDASDDGSDTTEVGGERYDSEKKGDASKDVVPELLKMENYRGYALPRPPSYRTDSAGSGTTSADGKGSSALSGTTKASAEVKETQSGAEGDVHKPAGRYKDPPTSSQPAQSIVGGSKSPQPGPDPKLSSTDGAPQTLQMVPATPSLINAITRIQQAQVQAKAWQESQKGRADAPYASASILKTTATQATQAGASPPSSKSTSAAPATIVPSVIKFNKWWDKEVTKK